MTTAQAFLARHALPDTYWAEARRWFNPLLAAVADGCRTRETPVVGIHGCQGSGKSTLADYLVRQLEAEHGLRAVSLSLDDFYRSHAERRVLAETVHPLLQTRGVPGTHDVALAEDTLTALRGRSGTVRVPRFDKSTDNPVPDAERKPVTLPVDAVVLEGWCLGVTPQAPAALETPVNALEAGEDPDGRWRRYVNTALADYQPLFDRVDLWVMLRAPGFDTVRRWRGEQEAKLAEACRRRGAGHWMNERELARFVQHFQRLTEHALHTLPERMHYCYTLDNERRVVALDRPVPWDGAL